MAKARVAPLRSEQAFFLAGEPRPDACPTMRGCAIGLAERSEADYLLQLATKKRGTGWHLSVDLIDGQAGETAARGERSCRDCSTEAAGAQLVDLFASLFDQARQRARSRLALRVEPAAAQLVLDDLPLGPAPFSGVLLAGTRQLHIQQRGYQDLHRSIELREGQTTELRIELEPEREPPPAPLQAPSPTLAGPGKRSTLRLVLGGVSLAGGALLMGYGASGLALNNKCEDLSITDTTQCPQIYKTGTAGGVLLGLGIALSGTGVLLLALPPAKRRLTSPAARVVGPASPDAPSR
jgi:hypothetical protein